MKNRDLKAGLLLCLVLILGLSGCGSAEDYAIRHSDVAKDADYVQYVEWRDEGKLEQDGSYQLEPEDAERPDGAVRVTFGINPRIAVKYYYDETLTRSVNTGSPCYLMPGDALYCAEPVCDASVSSTYHFDRFNVYACEDGGSRKRLAWETSDGAGTVFRIPADYEGTELSVEPVGAVSERTLKLEDYIYSNGSRQETNGTWIVNTRTTTRTSVEVVPIEPLKVEYQYDADQYCYVSSSPGSYYHDNGSVIFDTVPASEGVEAFSVELRLIEDERFHFDPALYSYDHGTVAFFYQGEEITSACDLKDGASLDYEVTATEDGYYSPKPRGSVTVNAADPDRTEADIRSIPINSTEPVVVRLAQPKAGGRIQYSVDGKTVEQDKCSVVPGTVITMKFLNWNGWTSAYTDGMTYTATDTANQSTFDEAGKEKVFRESQDHKPTLTVVLEDGLMSETVFDIAAAGVSKTDLSYDKGKTTNRLSKDRQIFSGTIGTQDGVTLTARDDTLLSGTALRLDIVMTDVDGKDTTAVRYITKLPRDEKIAIYNNPASATVTCKEINITVSKVDITTYTAKNVVNGSVTVSLSDTSTAQTLRSGDILEADREVRVTIRANSGYYVVDSDKETGSYSKVMKYSKWLSDCEKILEKHPIQKYWTITLDTSDPYGTCVYKLDGKKVYGTVEVRFDQKLTLEYTLTDPDYQIVRGGIGGFVGNIVSSNKESCTVELSEDMDGSVIRRSDYISIEKKEG